MFAELEEFYQELETLDVWLDQAIEKTQDLQSLQADIDTQYQAFKVTRQRDKQILKLTTLNQIETNKVKKEHCLIRQDNTIYTFLK